MSSTTAQESFSSIPDGFTSNETALVHIRYSFLIGLGIFLLMFPLYRSKKSFFDAIAVNKIIRITRFIILLQFISFLILLNSYLSNGPPIILNQAIAYGDGNSWLYSYHRAVYGIIFIVLSGFSEVHPIIRIISISSILIMILSDSLSAVQVYDYLQQIKDRDAPTNGYTIQQLINYYWRDIISVGLLTIILLLVSFLTCILGCCMPQLINYSEITGSIEFDRPLVMRANKGRRKAMELLEQEHRTEKTSLKLRNKKQNSSGKVEVNNDISGNGKSVPIRSISQIGQSKSGDEDEKKDDEETGLGRNISDSGGKTLQI